MTLLTSPSSPLAEPNPWFTVGEDEVRLLRDGAEAFPAMLEAIARARTELVVEFYWLATDAIGRRFRDAFVEASGRGVKVRVIYDSLGSRGVTDEWWRPLRLAGGEVREYHPISPFHAAFRLDRLMQRDHRKLLVVDRSFACVGGVNIGDAWAPVSDGGGGWRDYAIAARGGVAADVRALFYRTWHRIAREPLPADVTPSRPERGRSVYVQASQRRRRRSIYREYRARIGEARRTIDLAHSYFIPDRAIRRDLLRAAGRGVRVRILVPQVSDVPVFQLAVEALFESFLASGIEIYAMPPPMLHAKMAIVDTRFVTVGSYNLDERLRKNIEANIAVVDPRFGTYATRCFEEDLTQARAVDRITWGHRSLFRRGAEQLALALRGLQ